MGDFEVTLTFIISAEDRFDAARRVYGLIDAQTPTSFWVCNEGGVGDEVRVEGMPLPRTDSLAQESVHELVDDLYRLGVAFGAAEIGDDERAHVERVKRTKRLLITAVADAMARPAS